MLHWSSASMTFKPLDVNLEHKDFAISFYSSMFKVGELFSTATEVFISKFFSELRNRLTSLGKGKISDNGHVWFSSGIPCEILCPADTKGWQKGKVRIKIILEFCPDEL